MVATAQAGNGGRQQNPAYRSARPPYRGCALLSTVVQTTYWTG